MLDRASFFRPTNTSRLAPPEGRLRLVGRKRMLGAMEPHSVFSTPGACITFAAFSLNPKSTEFPGYLREEYGLQFPLVTLYSMSRVVIYFAGLHLS